MTPDLNDLDGDGIPNAVDPDVDSDNKPNRLMKTSMVTVR